jgi:hypothetical protein
MIGKGDPDGLISNYTAIMIKVLQLNNLDCTANGVYSIFSRFIYFSDLFMIIFRIF